MTDYSELKGFLEKLIALDCSKYVMEIDDLQAMIAENEALLELNADGLAVLRTQREQLDCYIKDAERYRFLRNGPDGIDLSSADSMEDIDALIDLTMSKEKSA
ncbi:hypothetical protein [Pseudomonas sp. GM67]|uniref:hypothetical protein n=1 Tax=Pseudomonas sp. GM67 TaxID=1144335 RepID=UPI000270C38F|nr:hypothetical protein [Pseudomonas sp. GM67]EJM92477.1 hypothetical protein PMI33_00734 [Pseudomonas sp. GM67]